MRVDGLDRHMCGQDPWWQATNASDLGTVNRLKLCCGYFHLNRSTNHQIISNQIALLFAEEHREASLVWLLLAPHSFRLVKVATALSVTKTKRPNSTKKSLALWGSTKNLCAVTIEKWNHPTGLKDMSCWDLAFTWRHVQVEYVDILVAFCSNIFIDSQLTRSHLYLQWLRPLTRVCHQMPQSPTKWIGLAYESTWRNTSMPFQTPQCVFSPMSTAVTFVHISHNTEFAHRSSQTSNAPHCITQNSSCATMKYSGYPARGFAEHSNAPFYQTAVVLPIAQLTTAIKHTLVCGAHQNNSPSEPWLWEHTTTTWDFCTTYSPQTVDKDHWNESVPLQHYTSYKHNLFSPHINGANTNTEPTFHHHPHTAANFHKSATCLPTIGHPTQMCHTDPDDPRHHGDQPHRQGLLQHGLNRLLPRCLTHHQNRHHLTNSNSSRPRDGAPAIALQHLHPGPQPQHHHRQHNLKMMCGRLLHISTTQSHPPQPSALTTPKKKTVTAWRYQDPTYDSTVHHHQQQT